MQNPGGYDSLGNSVKKMLLGVKLWSGPRSGALVSGEREKKREKARWLDSGCASRLDWQEEERRGRLGMSPRFLSWITSGMLVAFS